MAKVKERPMAYAYVAQARAQYGSDDVEIDAKPKLSYADDGAWVAAWVWVNDDEAAQMEAEG